MPASSMAHCSHTEVGGRVYVGEQVICCIIRGLWLTKRCTKTQTARGSFSIFLSHNGVLPGHGSLPVTMARFGLVSAGVRRLSFRTKGS